LAAKIRAGRWSVVKSDDLWLLDIVRRRLAGRPVVSKRFGVVRVYGNVAYDNGYFWSFDGIGDAIDLCRLLITERLGAYVYDSDLNKEVFQQGTSPRSAIS